jgi:hypothetical protein
MDGDGRGWITIDKREVANFCTFIFEHESNAILRNAISARPDVSASALRSEIVRQLAVAGTMPRRSFYEALHQYRSLSIDDAIVSDTMLTRALAMTDRRLGKRRLQSLKMRADEHPLVRLLYAIRCEAEGVSASAVQADSP